MTTSPYTCPSCRATVRETRPNATVTTLLELLLTAHPEKAKTQEDRAKIAEVYKPGDVVIKPVVLPTSPIPDDDDDLEDAREESLRDLWSQHNEHHHRQSQGAHGHGIGLEHQSSIRSLLSASDLESAGMEEEIMRQIMEEGLLDGIDLNSLTPDQEEEITERIAGAVRRRRRRQRRRRETDLAIDRTRRGSPEQMTQTPGHIRHHSYRTSDSELLGATSLSDRRRARSADHRNQQARPSRHEGQTRPSTAEQRTELADDYHACNAVPRPSHPQGDTTNLIPRPLTIRNHEPHGIGMGNRRPGSRQPDDRQDDHVQTAHGTPTPDISCPQCYRTRIQEEVHYNCSVCDSGDFNICIVCYRNGKGCKHWLGFGYAALARFRQTQSVSSTAAPHILSARRYRHDETDGQRVTLETGLFCEGCQALSNDCYWHCEICNDGAWGYCSRCVQTGQHCTHPLEAMAKKELIPASDHQHQHQHDQRDALPSIIKEPTIFPRRTKRLPHVPDPKPFAAILLPCNCAKCERPIHPLKTRYHCSACLSGDYYLCALCSDLTVTREGQGNTRLCPEGHFMSPVTFQLTSPDNALLRITLNHPASNWSPAPDTGWRWHEPDGSAVYLNAQTGTLDTAPTLRVQALWSYWPSASDELGFPRGATISETHDINGDWLYGTYAGRRGLLPRSYVRNLH